MPACLTNLSKLHKRGNRARCNWLAAKSILNTHVGRKSERERERDGRGREGDVYCHKLNKDLPVSLPGSSNSCILAVIMHPRAARSNS